MARLWVLLAVVCLTGCGHAARKDVRAIVDHERAILGMNRAVIRIPEVDAYLSSWGKEVIGAAVELDNAYERQKSQTLDIYDLFDVYLVHSVTPNAWMWGDDFACITTTLFLEAESPEELIAVLAHEFGHIREKHSVEREERKYAARARYITLAALTGAIAGYTGDTRAMSIVLNNSDVFLNNYVRHRIGDEIEADDYALRIYAHLRLEPSRSDDFFERLLRNYGNWGGHTHPVTTARIRRIRQFFAGRDRGERTREVDLAEFRAMQRAVAYRIVQLADAGVLYSTEWERERLRSTGYAMYPASSCGVFFVDYDVLFNDLVQAIRLRLSSEVGAGE